MTSAPGQPGRRQRRDVYPDGTSNWLVRVKTRIVAVVGVKDLVVETKHAVLVAHKDQVQRE